MKTVIPILADNVEAFIDRISTYDGQADVLEYRIDSIPGLRPVQLQHILDVTTKSKRCITNRTTAEGGSWQGLEGERIQLLLAALMTKTIDYLDIELAAGHATITQLKKAAASNTKLIISHHNLLETPAEPDLVNILHQQLELGADIAKIVTFARNVFDNVTILNLLRKAREQDVNIVALCMGEKGLMSRAVAPLLGSALSYGTSGTSPASAPGQVSLTALQQVWDIIGIPPDEVERPLSPSPTKPKPPHANAQMKPDADNAPDTDSSTSPSSPTSPSSSQAKKQSKGKAEPRATGEGRSEQVAFF